LKKEPVAQGPPIEAPVLRPQQLTPPPNPNLPQRPTRPPAKPGEPGLDIGNLALEIDGEDIDGKKFKLSDYRGKVVVLDFWGNW
jgi:hypothetical protein